MAWVVKRTKLNFKKGFFWDTLLCNYLHCNVHTAVKFSAMGNFQRSGSVSGQSQKWIEDLLLLLEKNVQADLPYLEQLLEPLDLPYLEQLHASNY